MAMSNKERQARHRQKLADRGIGTVTVPWPKNCPHAELYMIGEYLVAHPDCTYVPLIRDGHGKFRWVKGEKHAD
jgi:hypothetical protein